MRFGYFNNSVIPMVALAALFVVSPSIAKEKGKHEYTRGEYNEWQKDCETSCDLNFCRWKCIKEYDDRVEIACGKYKEGTSEYDKCSGQGPLLDQCMGKCTNDE